MDTFLLNLRKYGVKLNSKDQAKILDAFPGGNDESAKQKTINIARIYD
jgi:hypothetical protein